MSDESAERSWQAAQARSQSPIPKRIFRLLALDETPVEALTWSTAAQRNRCLLEWRRAVFALFGDQSRCMRTLWVLSELFNTKLVYANPSDLHLARETGLALNKLEETLTLLDRAKAIIRVHVPSEA